MGESRGTWIAAVVGKPLFGESEMTLWNWDVTRTFCDAVPERLQIFDLLSF